MPVMRHLIDTYIRAEESVTVSEFELAGSRLETHDECSRDHRYGHWLYRRQIRLTDRRRVRIFGVPTTIGLPDTRVGAARAERMHRDRALKTVDTMDTSGRDRTIDVASLATSLATAVLDGDHERAAIIARATLERGRMDPDTPV
jgi:hypothetical protein